MLRAEPASWTSSVVMPAATIACAAAVREVMASATAGDVLASQAMLSLVVRLRS